MVNASLRLRKLLITPNGGKPFLLIEVEIEGPHAPVSFRLPGEYVATLATHFALIAAEHPELCGAQGTVKEQFNFEGEVRPGKEILN